MKSVVCDGSFKIVAPEPGLVWPKQTDCADCGHTVRVHNGRIVNHWWGNNRKSHGGYHKQKGGRP